MITLKYEKTPPAVFISHIDLLRGMARIIRRTGYTPEFSKGFNPHMLVFFSPPLAVAVSSVCEYVTIDIKGVAADEFFDAFNRSAPQGIRAVKVFESEKSPNLAGRITSAEYFFPVKNDTDISGIVDKIKNSTVFEIEYIQKNKHVKKDVRNMIKDISAAEGGLKAVLSTGNENLRADRLLNQLKKNYGIDTEVTGIVKTAQFVNFDGKNTDVDDDLKTEGCTL